MPGVGQYIQISDYDGIKHRVDAIFGNGSVDTGYGQSVTSQNRIAGSMIDHADWAALRADMIKARQHQTGISVGSSNVVDNQNLVVINSGDIISNATLTQYSSFASQLTVDRFSVVNSQLALNEELISDTRSTPWNNTITHSVAITGNADGNGASANLRYFFNAGGKIRINASRTGGNSTSVNTAWSTMLSTMGDVIIDHDSTGASVGTGSNIGWFSLTTAPQIVYTYTAAVGSYTMYASTDTARMQLFLAIQITNAAHGVGDINVDGVLTSSLYQDRPAGNNVTVLSNTATATGLATTGNANPQYTMTITPTTVNEGSAVNVTLSTTYVPNGTILRWTALGTTLSTDFTDGLTTGTFKVNSSDGVNGSGAFTRTLALDFKTNATAKNFDVNVYDLLGNSVVIPQTVHVNDTSVEVYSVTTPLSVVPSDALVRFAVNTTGVSNTTILYWKMTGTIQASDFSDTVLTGSFSVSTVGSTGTATISRQLLNNGHLGRSMALEIRTGSVSGPVVATSPVITVTDATYRIVADAYTIPGGNSITFNITTTGVSNGTVLTWAQTANSTTVSSDFNDGAISGSVTIQNGVATLVRTTVSATNETSITKYLSIGLTHGGVLVTTSSQVSINYSANVSYAIAASSSAVDEGSAISFSIQTQGVSTSQPLYWSITGDPTVVAGTFTQGLTGGPIYVDNSGNVSVTLNVTSDTQTTGARNFVFNLLKAGIIKQSSTTITINDTSTSVFNPVYTISPISVQAPSNIVQITHTITGGSPNSIVALSGGSNAAYVLPSGGANITLDGTGNGSASLASSVAVPVITQNVPITITATFPSNGAQYVGGNLRTKTFNVVGVVPGYTMVSDKTSINEDNVPVRFTITANWIPSGTSLYWKAVSTSLVPSDFTGELMTGRVTVLNSSAIIALAIKPDLKTNPGRSLTMHVYSDVTYTTEVVTAITVNVNDTSKTVPTGSIDLSTTTVNEGQPVTVTITVHDVDIGTTLYLDKKVLQGVDTGDFSVASGSSFLDSGTVILTNSVLSSTFQVVADSMTEGTEKFQWLLYLDQSKTKLLATSPILTINDTSKSIPSGQMVLSTDTVDEGQPFSLTLTTQNVDFGSTLYVVVASTYGTYSNDIAVTSGPSSINGQFVLNSSTVKWNCVANSDLTTEGVEKFQWSVYLDQAKTKLLVTSSELTVNDTSKTLPGGSLTLSTTTITEGQTFTLALNAQNIDMGSVLYLDKKTITGSDAGDFSFIGGPSIDGNGAFSLTVNPVTWTVSVNSDELAEGTEKYQWSVYSDQSKTRLVSQSQILSISDLVVIPPYPTISYPATVVTGVVYSWSISNGPKNGRWYATDKLTNTRIPASGTKTLDASGAASYSDGVLTTLGVHEWAFVFTNADNTPYVYDQATFHPTIVDVSDVPKPSATLVVEPVRINEGQRFSITLNTENFDMGTPLYPRANTIQGTYVSDFINPEPAHWFEGEIIVNSPTMTWSAQASIDEYAESSEKYQWAVYWDAACTQLVATSNVLTVDDKTPGGTITVTPTTVNEGQQYTITLDTTNVDLGTQLYVEGITVQGIDINDFTIVSGPAISNSSFVLNASSVSWVVNVTADQVADGVEKFKWAVYFDSAKTRLLAQSGDLTINDTSKPMVQEWITPGSYDWTVPAGVTSVGVTAIGGGGGGGGDDRYQGAAGTAGASATTTLNVTGGQVLAVIVGGGGGAGGTGASRAGGAGGSCVSLGGTGGNGGSSGGRGTSGSGGGGGGVSGIIRGGFVLIAAGGGGGGGGGGNYASAQPLLSHYDSSHQSNGKGGYNPYSESTTVSGAPGLLFSSDGGGGGGGGGGYPLGGWGGNGHWNGGDGGGHQGESGQSYAPGGSVGIGSNGSPTRATAGGNGYVKLTWIQ